MVSRAILAFLAALATGPALAQSGQCDWLQSQYLAATRQGAGGGEDAARQLGQARAAADRMNCMGGFFAIFGPPPAPGCAAVMANINRLQASLAPRAFGGFFRPDAGSLREELRANRCQVPYASYGSARTICVRACDGYYFPINAASQRSRWKADAEACQSMYGAAGQAELYTYDPDGDVTEARSVTGKRYGDQPFAFLYRNSHDQACASQLTTGIAALGARYLARKLDPRLAKPAVVSRAMPVPQIRPADAEDPETAANRTGDLAPGGTSPPAVGVVRLVGPSYYAEVYSRAKPDEPKPSWWQRLFGGARAAEMTAAAPSPDRRAMAAPISVSQSNPAAR